MLEPQASPLVVLTVGETMALCSPIPPGNLLDADFLTLGFAGAESTVALYLAHLGHRVHWLSRVGADPFGERLLDFLGANGVLTGAVAVDASSPTGVFFKHPTPVGTKVFYYRAGSAASKLSPDQLVPGLLEGVRLVHVSGITPALSASAAATVERLLECRDQFGYEVSFDVNHRPALWPAQTAGPTLLGIARRSDVVFVGLDEAEALWGSTDAASVRKLIRGPELVVKDGAVGATAFMQDASAFEPATRVEVTEPVGAGDSFAAGYLHRRQAAEDLTARLRYGHVLASSVLQTTADFVPPAPEEIP